ncbi:hypothetical protein [Francisella adeliensis]|uniref:Uncharacterized protein n=1 Tax=Francisella adeliensis TaxID=2007306 RepID=A0A2Z4XZQ2_9GAMM|nr:hypothetical protein [Francisella adeliensis]AXA34367.1 hypothetical protein CDH04_08145 [Francisella adeliensis]MBK2086454.1 hypothetical protein [Francisella adeliensis]MBK2096082.1 hypothetical protein [Francisella adeliensis]QIW12614.1 hypothetical protein FZC43_08150 [Francisella adeliensis]QIW14487.1 hypothetical protein FZC44_08145 [Francisella adeliensis]
MKNAIKPLTLMTILCSFSVAQANSIDDSEFKKKNQIIRYYSANNNDDQIDQASKKFKDFAVNKVKDILTGVAGTGFNYLMNQTGLSALFALINPQEESVTKKLDYIIKSLEKIQKGIDIIQDNQKIMKTYIVDGFYNANYANYASQLEKTLFLLDSSNSKNKSDKTKNLKSTDDFLVETISNIDLYYDSFFIKPVEINPDIESDQIISYVENNLVYKTSGLHITQDNINSIISLRDNLLKRLNSNYLPAPTDKSVLLDSIKTDLSLDLAQSIDYLNYSVTSVNLTYAILMQKTYMVIQALTVLIDKDPAYKDFYIAKNMKESTTLSEQLKDNVVKINTKIDDFTSSMDRLYIKNKIDIFRSTSNLLFVAGENKNKMNIDLAKEHCVIAKYVPSSKFVSIACTEDIDPKKIDYKYKFASYLNTVADGYHVPANFMSFNYGSNISENERFILNYDNFYKREDSENYFGNGSKHVIDSINDGVILQDTIGLFVGPFECHLDDKTDKYQVDKKPVWIYDSNITPGFKDRYYVSYSTLIHFQETGNWVFINNDISQPYGWFLGGLHNDFSTYIGGVSEDNTKLEATRVPSKNNDRPMRHYAIQQGFMTGASLIMDYSDSLNTLEHRAVGKGTSAKIYTYNPLKIDIKIDEKEVKVALGGNWLQYCDRRSAKVEPTTKNGAKGWKFTANCHEDMANANDLKSLELFIGEKLVANAADTSFKLLNITYDKNAANVLSIK